MRCRGKHASDYVHVSSDLWNWTVNYCKDKGSGRSDLLERSFAYHITPDDHEHLFHTNNYLYTHYIAVYLRLSLSLQSLRRWILVLMDQRWEN